MFSYGDIYLKIAFYDEFMNKGETQFWERRGYLDRMQYAKSQYAEHTNLVIWFWKQV